MKKNKKIIVVFLFMITSFICLFFCTRNSPYYCFNDWVDENAFMTVGKSWLFGIIPYKDIFEQKGPFLYLIFALANLISSKSFIGVFIFEIISMAISLCFAYKINRLYLNQKCSTLSTIFLCPLLTSCDFFVQGGSAEEFCFPFIFFSIYSLLRMLKDDNISNIEIFYVGLFAGVAVLIKFNTIGLWVGYLLTVLILYLKEKKIKELIKKVLFWNAGFLIPILGFSLYFVLNHAFKEFIETYLVFNCNNYSYTLSLGERVKKVFEIYYSQISSSFLIINLTYIGSLLFVLSKRYIDKFYKKILLIQTYIFSFFGIFFGGFAYDYYFLFMMPYIILSFILIFDNLQRSKLSNIKKTLVFILFALFCVYNISKSNNIYFHEMKLEDTVQYKFSEEIRKTKNPTLLNFGSLDGGFYMMSDVLPSVKYFEQQNVYIPGADDLLHEMINEKMFDYIVVRTDEMYDPRGDFLYDNYTLIKKQSQVSEGVTFKYYLYKRK